MLAEPEASEELEALVESAASEALADPAGQVAWVELAASVVPGGSGHIIPHTAAELRTEIEPQPTVSEGRVAATHSPTGRQAHARISVEPEGS